MPTQTLLCNRFGRKRFRTLRWLRIPIWSLILGFPISSVAASAAETVQLEAYRYRIKGKVRLLIFWVSRDDVGGGTIAAKRNAGKEEGSWSEEVEILFGSKPERVPGKINRWGYGRETGEWSRDPASGQEVLQQTVFEGFMRHSKEQSLSEVQANESRQKSDQDFLYDGILSTVLPKEHVAEVRTFAATGDFDYRNPSPIRCGYQQRVRSGPPDRTRLLPHSSAGYTAPYGFLTAVRAALRSIVAESERRKNWLTMRPEWRYAYNGKPYQLKLKDLELEKDFALLRVTSTGAKADSGKIDRVARAEFSIRESGNSDHHDFTLWFPLAGTYRAVPVRIEDKPRWWLRIVLDLEAGAEQLARESYLAKKQEPCPASN